MNSATSDLKSLMEAEEELNAIFSKKKDLRSYCGYSANSGYPLWSPDKNSSISTTGGFSEQQSLDG